MCVCLFKDVFLGGMVRNGVVLKWERAKMNFIRALITSV